MVTDLPVADGRRGVRFVPAHRSVDPLTEAVAAAFLVERLSPPQAGPPPERFVLLVDFLSR